MVNLKGFYQSKKEKQFAELVLAEAKLVFYIALDFSTLFIIQLILFLTYRN